MNAPLEAIAAVAESVRVESHTLNSLDAIAGDGDLGVTMSIAAIAIFELLPSLKGQTLPTVLSACGNTIARKAPSTGGTLIASGILRAAHCAASIEVMDSAAIAKLLETAAEAIAERGGAGAGAKTMLDALLPAAQAARDSATCQCTLSETLSNASWAARRGAEETKSMRPRFGRAGWLAERSMGHEDAGARLIAIILESIARQARLAEPSSLARGLEGR